MDYKAKSNMSPEVKDCQMPKGAFSEKFDQSPLTYKERQDARQSKAGAKLRSEAFKGRYSS